MTEAVDRIEPPDFQPEEASTVLYSLECHSCKHAEGRHPKGGGAWNNAGGIKTYPVEEALKAQNSLRQAAGLEPERFPIEAFVGMISDEIESLRTLGKTDEQIAAMVRQSSSIDISAAEIAEHYASPEERHPKE